MNDLSSTRQMQLEIEAATKLREQLTALGYGEDCELIRDTIEAETSLDAMIDKLVEQMAEDRLAIDGIDAFAKKIKVRKDRIERRNEDIRDLVLLALSVSEKRTHRAPLGTVSRANAKRKLVVTSESDIPSKWWKAADPTLNKSELTDYLKARTAAISTAAEIKDQALRDEALRLANETYPAIPGAELSNGGEILVTRFE